MKLDRLQQLAIGIGAIIFAYVFVEFFLLKGDYVQITRLEQQIVQHEQNIQKAKQIQREATALQEQMKHLQDQLERLKKVLPLEVNKPRFIAEVRRYANENGIEIRRVSTNRVLQDDIIYKHPFSYEAVGKYHDFGAFFAQLSNYSKIVNVSGLSLDKAEGEVSYPVVCSFIVTLFTYREPSPQELKKQLEEKKKEMR
jgi:Tfp pilus assembly protein PilO